MDRFEKGATPFTAPTVLVPESVPLLGTKTVGAVNGVAPFTAPTDLVPESVPLPGLVPIATVTAFAAVVTGFPNASWTAICTAGLMIAPGMVLVGWPAKASFDAAPAVMLKPTLVAPASPAAAAVRVYPVPTLSTLMPENVAFPFAAVAVVVPESVPAVGFVPNATVMVFVAVGTVFPTESSTAS